MTDFFFRIVLLLCFIIIVITIVVYEWFWEKREEEAKKRHEERMQELRDWEKFFEYLDSLPSSTLESDFSNRARVVDDTIKSEEEGK